MANEVRLKTQIINKHDIEENWEKAIKFIPEKGQIIVYDIDDMYPYERFKIGDGISYVSNLPFAAPQIQIITWEEND